MLPPGWVGLVGLVTLLVCHGLLLASSQDTGFGLLFESNDEEYTSWPVPFHPAPPSWIRGKYIRNGLGRFNMGMRQFTHAFDGFAKLSSWNFNNGTVLFNFKFVLTNFYRKSKQKQDIAPYLLFQSTDPPFDRFKKLVSLYHGIDNTNTQVLAFGDRTKTFVAVSDFWPQYVFDADTMETRERLDPVLPVGSPIYYMLPVPSSSHPVQEHGTTNFISFYSLLNPVPWLDSTIVVTRIIDADNREAIAQIKRNNIPYMHSLAVSTHYAIIFAHPAIIDPWKMLKTVIPIDSVIWRPEERTDVYVVRLSDGHVTQFSSAAVFHMHHANSVEVNGSVHIDMTVYPDMAFIKGLELNLLRDPIKRNELNVHPSLRRYVINMNSDTIKWYDFAPTIGREFVNRLDLPAINEHFRFRRYCYVYGVVIKGDGNHTADTRLAKKDVCNANRDQFWFVPNHYPLAPWFIQRPNSVEEDDGVVLSLVLDGLRGKSYLLVLDAKNMTTISTGYLPTAVPFSIHGQFFQDP